MPEPLMMSLRNAVEKYGVSYGCLRKWCLTGVIANVRSGTKFLINTRSLEQFLYTSGLKDQEEH